MSVRSLAATLSLLGLLAAGPVRAQTVITGSPIPSPIPVDPASGHSLRHSRRGAPTVRRSQYRRHHSRHPHPHHPRPHYQGSRLEPRSARGYRRFHRGAVAPDFERRDRFGRRQIIIITD